MSAVKLALGPVQYYWPREQMLRFYADMAETPVDIIYLGETVCSRRHELRLPDWLELAAMLKDAGKAVVLSTQVLLETAQDGNTMRKVAAQEDFLVEANDMGAVHRMAGRSFVAGPFLNIYNASTLQLLESQGARRWVMPLEMGRDGLAVLQQARPQGMQTEVFAYGRMPLAFSARCFTARNRNLPKNNCQYVCMDHPDGLLLETREGEAFLVLNGIQTQSALVYNLIDAVGELAAMGVDVLRISPQSAHTEDIIQLFRRTLDGELPSAQALERMRPLMPAEPCNGFWHGRPGLEQWVA